jgi:HSP20 family protein
VAVLFDPFREMDRLTSQLTGPSGQARTPRWMPMDLYRSGDHYVVNIDLPGVDPGSIDVDVDGNTLTVRAQRTLLGGEGELEWIAQERPTGSYMRQLSLGDGLDVHRIHAHYENGVLSMTIPVSEKGKPRKIQVESRGGQQRIEQGEQSSGGAESTERKETVASEVAT